MSTAHDLVAACPSPHPSILRSPKARRAGLLFASVAFLAVVGPAFGATPVFQFRWGSWGTAPGQFQELYGIARHPDGRIYTSEAHGRIQIFSPEGTLVGGWTGPSSVGINCDDLGNIYQVSQSGARVSRYTADGTPSGSFGSSGSGDGQFERAYDVAIGHDQTVYVSDWYLARITRFTSDGTFLSKWGGYGSGPGQFLNPNGVAVAPTGNVYVVDRINYRVQYFDADGNFLGQWGARGTGPGQFLNPLGITVDAAGDVYVTDTYSSCAVMKFSPTGELLWTIGGCGSDPGQLGDPWDVVVDDRGTVFVADRHGYVHVFADRPVSVQRTTWASLKARYR